MVGSKDRLQFLAGLVVALVCAFLIALWAHSVLIGDYENKSYNADTYVQDDHYRKIINKIIEECKSSDAKSNDDHEYCKNAQESVTRLAGISDLAAQQTMATATRGILYATWFQIFIGAVALAFLVLTVWQSSQAAAYTSRIFSETKNANELELQPYLTIKYRGVLRTETIAMMVQVSAEDITQEVVDMNAHDFGIQRDGLSVEFRIFNKGKTPVSDLFVDVSEAYVTYESSDFGIETYRSNEKRPSFSDNFLIPAGGHCDAMIGFAVGQIGGTNKGRFFDKSYNEHRFMIQSVTLKDVVIRYKDFTCKKDSFHKVVRGELSHNVGVRSGPTGTTWTENCPDIEHHYYASKLEPGIA